jgi:hypothetical protein
MPKAKTRDAIQSRVNIDIKTKLAQSEFGESRMTERIVSAYYGSKEVFIAVENYHKKIQHEKLK